MNPMRSISIVLALAVSLPILGCELDVPDLNNPGIGDLEENPTRSAISAACTGLLIGARRNHAQANGFVAQLGILGREAYNFDQADPRFVGELLQGSLNRGSPFGGNFWALPYANIRLANTILGAVDAVPDLSEAERSAITGFSNTIKAYDLLEIIVTRDDNGAVIDTDRELGEELAPIEDKAAVYAEIERLLDDAATALAAGGDEFPFALSSGFAGLDTPATFRTFNRALRARVSAYQMEYADVLTALAESFLDPAAPLTLGAYHAYSTGPGDTTNNLINPNIYAHPSLATDAQMNAAVTDLRFTSKVAMTDTPGSAQGLTSDLVFTIYDSPSAPAAIIRNEELILLRAEARWFEGDKPGALEDLNLVRTQAGGLAEIVTAPATDDAFIDALLYERRYSLMFEWGHRWIDTRRFGRIETLPLDMPDHVRNARYPIPLAECNARPGEPRCAAM